MNDLLNNPIAFKLPWTRFGNGPNWRRMEVVATKFGDDGTPIAWAVRESGSVLNKNGQWEHEPLPSSRCDAFLERTRWPTALEAAEAAAKLYVTNQSPGAPPRKDSP